MPPRKTRETEEAPEPKAEPKAEHSWEQRQPLLGNAKNASLLTLVEAVLV